MTPEAKNEPGPLDGASFGPSEPRLTPTPASEPAISLATVLSTDMSIAWDESVSIVEALCEAVQGSVLRSIPASKHIFLTRSGTVAVRSGAGTPEPVEAGRHLLDLLGKGTVPAPLRLFASQAVRADQHGSILAFQQGLEYFAKPGGRERIIAVFERCSAELAAMPFPSETETKTSKALDRVRTSGEPSALWRWGREAALAGGAVVVTVLVVWAGYFAWQELSRPSADPAPVAEVPATAPTPPDQPAAPDIAIAPSSAPSARPGGPVGRPAGNAPSPVAAVAPRLGAPVEVAVDRQPASPSPTATADIFGSAPAPAVVAPSAPPTPLFVQEPAVEPPDMGRVYTSSDPGVMPATLIREQLLPPAMGVPAGASPLRLELLVSAEGTVERARFLVPPRRMADMMLLSSAKMWLFNPALKDGRPVRSRVVLSYFVAP
jgi:hypothetical protein